MLDGPDLALVQDLAAGYGVDEETSRWSLSPRMALRLVTQAQLTADLARGNLTYFTEDDDILPPALVDAATPEFLERFRQSFENLVRRLRHPDDARGFLAECVGDEVALAHVLRLARDAFADGEGAVVDNDPELALLPEAPDLDTDFDFYEGVLFADRDFELLWHEDTALTAADDQQALAFRLLNLRPDRWFLPFDP